MANSQTAPSRLAVLRAMTVDERAACIAAQPSVAASILRPIATQNRRHGTTLFDLPFASTSSMPQRTPRLDVESLAARFGESAALNANVAGLSGSQIRLLTVAHFHGGSATRAQLAAEPHGMTEAELDAVIESLVLRLLLVRSDGEGDGGVRLLPGVRERVALPLPSLATAVRNDALTTDQLALLLLGAAADVPSRKAERAAAVAELCADADGLRRVLLSLSPPTLAIVSRLLEAGRPVSLTTLGIDPWRASFMRATKDETFGAYVELRHRALVWEDASGDIALWMELFHVSTNAVFAPWPRSVELDVEPIIASELTQPTTASTIATLLRAIANEPLPALKSGGIGVSTIRALAKRLSIPPERITVLLDLLRAWHVIVPRSELLGKGRRAEFIVHFHVDGVLAEALMALDGVRCWAAVVDQWLDGADHIGAVWHAEYDANVGRREIIADLLNAAPGTGFDAERFVTWQSHRHTVCDSRVFETVVEELRSLELVPPDGPVGLTPLARLLLVDPEAAAAAVPTPASTFVVQPDHTVVADARLDVSIRAELERLSTIVSTGGALVFRLDPSKIAAELSNGVAGEAISEFLASHAAVPLPAAVRTLVADAERQRGGLTINTATTVLTADDPVVLARAVAVKPAKLRLVSPTVAVSALKPSVVANALRAKGLAPSSGDSIVEGMARAVEPAPRHGSSNATDALPVLAARVVNVVHPDRAAIARTLLAAHG